MDSFRGLRIYLCYRGTFPLLGFRTHTSELCEDVTSVYEDLSRW